VVESCLTLETLENEMGDVEAEGMFGGVCVCVCVCI
jgi:hypothetical protein